MQKNKVDTQSHKNCTQILGGLFYFFFSGLGITDLDPYILTCYYVLKKRQTLGFMLSDNNQSIWPLNSKYVMLSL